MVSSLSRPPRVVLLYKCQSGTPNSEGEDKVTGLGSMYRRCVSFPSILFISSDTYKTTRAQTEWKGFHSRTDYLHVPWDHRSLLWYDETILGRPVIQTPFLILESIWAPSCSIGFPEWFVDIWTIHPSNTEIKTFNHTDEGPNKFHCEFIKLV